MCYKNNYYRQVVLKGLQFIWGILYKKYKYYLLKVK